MTEKKKRKPKTQEIIMVKVDKPIPGLDMYSAIDEAAVKVLGGRKSFEAQIPVMGRTLSQNALWAPWYRQIAAVRGDMTMEEVKRECKLRYGVPILRAENKKFRSMYDAGFKHLSYEQKLEAMEFLPVTSILSKGQGVIYTETLQRNFAEQNIVLDVL